MSAKTTNFIAFILLAIMAMTALSSMKETALTFDELAHIPAGYSYLTKQDYRVNPEHPPLVKDISALPLLFLNLNWPDDRPVWTQKEKAPAWWVQFDLGKEFLYYSGNNPREIIFWSRLAIMCLLLFMGWLLFRWAKQIGGNIVAIGTLALFAFSPTFLAHGRLVNTDIGAVLGTLIAIFFWLKFLKLPTWQNILLAGIGFGIAMILKFSLVLLVPFFVIITLIYAILFADSKNKILKSILIYAGKSFLVGMVGVIFVIWPIYQFHIWNYPPEQQLRDTIADISSHPAPIVKDAAIWMTQQKITRPLAQYMRGLLMASQRTIWGNTTYFMGEISASSWLHYFPVIYLLKVPLAFHILTFIVLIAAIWNIWKIFKKRTFFVWVRKNFTLVVFFFWIIVYWTGALFGNLNIGVRHLLPVFPFMYIIIVWGVAELISRIPLSNLKRGTMILVLILFLWYIGSSLLAFPHYIPYYNELAGGSKEGYKVAVDSNYDWGQDFYRLLQFVEENEIDKIHLDYFGGEDPAYWLKDRYIPFNPKEMEKPPKGWLAVSTNQLQGGKAKPVRDFDQPSDYYRWLDQHTPIAKIGYSIFVYYID